ncbi:hypothetical protein ACFFGV_08605 [Pontibacillus salicampi]|uniref:Secreted protein n=1 Tax=Pontibacillus salicampi TaxID=1449801 RepID=A0ABV6LML5_9BACI
MNKLKVTPPIVLLTSLSVPSAINNKPPAAYPSILKVSRKGSGWDEVVSNVGVVGGRWVIHGIKQWEVPISSCSLAVSSHIFVCD